MNNNRTNLRIGDREIILLGTAHISKESVQEVKNIIEDEKPDRVCIEIDESRYKALTQSDAWRNLNIIRVLKEKKAA